MPKPQPTEHTGVTNKVRNRSPLETHDRMTAALTIHHESLGENPVSVESRWWDLLETREQPYERRIVVTPEGVDMDFGHVQNPGMVVIQNRTGQGLQTNPSEEQKKDNRLQILIIEPGGWIVRPGRAHVGDVSHCDKLRMRSLRGDLRITVVVFPR